MNNQIILKIRVSGTLKQQDLTVDRYAYERNAKLAILAALIKQQKMDAYALACFADLLHSDLVLWWEL